MGHPEPETSQQTTPVKPKEGLNGPPSSERLRLEVSCWAVYRSGAPNETRTR